MRVLLAGGGTGGHINPALAIADIIKTKYPDSEFLFAGTQNGMEAKLVPQAGYKLEKIKILCYTIFNSIRIEIPKHQEQDKEAEQNRQIIKTKNSRREVTASETQ